MVKRAFTLLELVLVIVILGIISFFTFEMTMQIFQSYTQSRILNNLQAQTELVLDQVIKRLNYRVRGSVIAKKIGSPNIAEGVYLPLWDPKAISKDGYHILEFVPYSYEAFRGSFYSGFADLDLSNSTSGLKTPGSDLGSTAINTFKDLTTKGTPPTAGINITTSNALGVFFPGQFQEKDIGYFNGSSQDVIGIAKAKVKSSDVLDIIYPSGKSITEQYHLAHTAIAIVPDIANTSAAGDFDLYLYYNYRPWEGHKFTDGEHTLLATHVTRFNFMQTDNYMVSLKVCMRAAKDTVGVDSTNFAICKSKAMF